MFNLERMALSALAFLFLSAAPAGCGPGAEITALPKPRHDGSVSLEAAVAARRSRRAFLSRAISLEAAGQLLWAAQGVTASRGARPGLRAAPSAGATYPLETWLVAGDVEGLAPGLYRYDPASHALEKIREGDLREPLAVASLGQAWVREAPAVIVLGAVYERTAARYGERAGRYTHMEAGHAGQNIYLQAEALGLGTVAVGAFRDEEVKRVLGVSPEPLYLYPVGHYRD